MDNVQIVQATIAFIALIMGIALVPGSSSKRDAEYVPAVILIVGAIALAIAL